MSVVAVAISLEALPSKASPHETVPMSKTTLVIDFTNIAGANGSPVGDTASTMQRRGEISHERKVKDAQ